MKRIAVLRGGPSDEYAVSMQTGRAVLDALERFNYPYRDIVITKKGEWLENGIVHHPEDTLAAVDLVFIALHGTYGEDGQVQRLFERKMIPFTGSRALPSAIAFNKELTKQTIAGHGIKTPKYRRIDREVLGHIDELIPILLVEIGPELFLKPVASGSSIGARYAPNAATLKVAILELLKHYNQVLVEEYVRGREATVGVLNNFRRESTYVLPVVEVVPPAGDPFFSYEDKYSGKTREIVPGRFSYHEKAELSRIAAAVHEVIGCKDYSRSDFIIRDGEVYFLEVNTLPGLTETSLFPKAAAAVGLSFPDLVKHLTEIAG